MPIFHWNFFLKTFKGINFIKAAHLRLAWHYLILGDKTKYQLSLSKVKNTGASIVDEDKQAKHESESAEPPNVSLLKSRLLFDGGYYNKAQEVLTNKSTKKNEISKG